MSLFKILSVFFGDIRRAFSKNEFKAIFSLTVITLTFGTVFYHFAEKWSWADSLYFSVMTLATIGYGDLSPTTQFTKIITVIYVLMGLGILLSFVTAIGEERIQNRINRRRR